MGLFRSPTGADEAAAPAHLAAALSPAAQTTSSVADAVSVANLAKPASTCVIFTRRRATAMRTDELQRRLAGSLANTDRRPRSRRQESAAAPARVRSALAQNNCGVAPGSTPAGAGAGCGVRCTASHVSGLMAAARGDRRRASRSFAPKELDIFANECAIVPAI
jgi:hypothetical protein